MRKRYHKWDDTSLAMLRSYREQGLSWEIIAGKIRAEVYPGEGISNWIDPSVSDVLPGFTPQTGIEEGLEIMIERYREIFNAVSN